MLNLAPDRKYLFFDTETSGLPASYKEPPSSGPNWPRILQLAWMLCDEYGHILDQSSSYVYPEPGLVIDPGAAAVNGLSVLKLKSDGKPLASVLDDFLYAYSRCGVLVAHNMAFDLPVIQSELHRKQMVILMNKTHLCTMETSRNFCKLPTVGAQNNRGTFKRPKLSELSRAVFGTEMKHAHDAKWDVWYLKEAFFGARESIQEWKEAGLQSGKQLSLLDGI